MNRNILRNFLAIFILAAIIYGLLSGQLHSHFEARPGFTAFIVSILLAYSAIVLRQTVRERRGKGK